MAEIYGSDHVGSLLRPEPLKSLLLIPMHI